MTEHDFLCDFCGRDWPTAQPFVEGHHGSCICGDCLRMACTGEGGATGGFKCTLCLEPREDLALAAGAAHLCRRCREQSARTLERDPSSGWRR